MPAAGLSLRCIIFVSCMLCKFCCRVPTTNIDDGNRCRRSHPRAQLYEHKMFANNAEINTVIHQVNEIFWSLYSQLSLGWSSPLVSCTLHNFSLVLITADRRHHVNDRKKTWFSTLSNVFRSCGIFSSSVLPCSPFLISSLSFSAFSWSERSARSRIRNKFVLAEENEVS